MRRHGTPVMLALIALVLGSCGGGAVEAADDGTLEITLTEFAFTPSEIVLHPGQTVTIVLDNQGEKDHEFMVGRTVRMVDGVPSGFEHDFFETVTDLSVDPPDALEGEMEGMATGDDSDAMGEMGEEEEPSEEEEGESMEEMEGDEHAEHTGFMVVRQPATQARITFTVTDDSIGEWEMGCFEEDGAHWDDGMQGTLVVEEV